MRHPGQRTLGCVQKPPRHYYCCMDSRVRALACREYEAWALRGVVRDVEMEIEAENRPTCGDHQAIAHREITFV